MHLDTLSGSLQCRCEEISADIVISKSSVFLYSILLLIDLNCTISFWDEHKHLPELAIATPDS